MADAEAYLKSREPEERYSLPAKFLPGEFRNKDIPGFRERADEEAEKEQEKEQEALNRKREEEGRPARLAVVRKYLLLKQVGRQDTVNAFKKFLTVNDLRELRKNGLEPPGFFTGFFGQKYWDRAVDVIDKIVPRDPMEDQEILEALQRKEARNQRLKEKIEGISTEGPHALAGRIIGSTTAYVVGKDPSKRAAWWRCWAKPVARRRSASPWNGSQISPLSGEPRVTCQVPTV